MLAPFLIAIAQPEPVRLNVDARDAARGIFSVREVVPASGSIALKVPKWIPGEHGPSGRVFDIVNIHFSQNGHVLEWRRDPLDLFTIHVKSQAGPLEATFQYVAPRHDVATRNLARIKWNRLIMLPDGRASTMVAPVLQTPSGWSVATALDFGHTGKLETTTAERLIDSPAVIGAYFKSYRLDAEGQPPATLEVFTEKPAEVPAAMVDDHKRLYKQALSFFGTPHFRHYQFLLTFSDQGAGEGLEHNESSEDGLNFDALKNGVAVMDLDSHEFAHSWCGKYRRPKGLADLDFDAPMNDEDLWVYEGFTQFAGIVLARRSQAWTEQQFLERLAGDIRFEALDETGRSWRSIEDTAIFGSLTNTMPDAWGGRRRGSDYYTEMVSVYLEADGIIRRESGGKKSIDDFARAFFGGINRGAEIRPFTRRELFETFNSAQPYDWARFFESRVFRVRPKLNDGWLEKSGWRLVLNDRDNEYATASQVGENKWADEITSVGLAVLEGEIRDVREGSAADRAGMAPGMKLISVNGKKYSVSALAESLKESTAGAAPLVFVVDDYDVVKTVTVDYHDGLKRAHFERVSDQPDLITLLGSASA